MLIVHVYIHVLPDTVEQFMQATIENAENSLQEQGVARFDVVQQDDDPTRFVLLEAYYAPEDALAHKQTAHYQRWRDTVAAMMAEPRTSVTYHEVHPPAVDW